MCHVSCNSSALFKRYMINDKKSYFKTANILSWRDEKLKIKIVLFTVVLQVDEVEQSHFDLHYYTVKYIYLTLSLNFQ